MSYVNTILNMLLWLFGSGAVVVIGVVIWKELQYKHKTVIKRINNSVRFTYIDKFKEYKNKEGILQWRLRKNRIDIPPAPNECVEVDNKGRYFVQYYQLDGGELIPAKDKFDLSDDTVKQKIISEAQPFTYSQRQIMVNQHKKSLEGKKKSIGEMVATAAPWIAIVMILVIFMSFFGEVVEPTKGLADANIAASERLAVSMDRIDGILHDRVRITDYEEISQGDNVTIPD